MVIDVNWPTTRFGVDINRAVPNAQQVVGGVQVQFPSLMQLPWTGDGSRLAQVITSSANRTISDTDFVLIYNRTTALAATSLIMPSALVRQAPLFVVDWAANTGTYPITFVPSGAETIMGQSSFIFQTDTDHARIELWPLPDLNGWYARP